MATASPIETDNSTTIPDFDFEKAVDSVHETSTNESGVSKDTLAQIAPLPPSPPETPDITPLDGGYGWVCVACCFFLNAQTWGINSSYGVFLANYLENNVFPGVTYLGFAFVGGLSISQAMLVSPIATIIVGRFGTRTCLFIGVFLQLLALIGASFAREFWQLLVTQGLCFGYGMGFLFVGSIGIIPQWFTQRRSLANGIGAAGSGFGGLIYSLAAEAIIKRMSLPWAFRIIGIVSGSIALTCALLLRDRNKHIGTRQLGFDYTMFKRVEFWLVQGYGMFTMLGFVVLIFSLPNYANYIGLTPHQASVISAVLNLGQVFGRPPVGYFSDSFGRINMAGTMTFASGLFALVIWTFAKSYAVGNPRDAIDRQQSCSQNMQVLIFYAFIAGTVAGTYWATIAPVCAEVVGLRDLPAALSITLLNLVLPDTFAEPIVLEITAHTGKYLGAQLFVGFAYIAAAICLLFLKAWKIGDLERLAEIEEKSVSILSPTPTPSAEDVEISRVEEARVKPRTSFMKRIIICRKV